MNIQIPPEIIKEIAGMLESGMKCFYHLPTGKFEYYPDEFKMPEVNEELWEEAMEKVAKNFSEYVAFSRMESYESYAMMEDFINEISDKKTQLRFLVAIERKKPFGQFKNLLLYYPDLRQQWFAYKDKRLIEYVRQQVEAYNNRLKNDEE